MARLNNAISSFIFLEYCKMEDQFADIFRKVFTQRCFENLREILQSIVTNNTRSVENPNQYY